MNTILYQAFQILEQRSSASLETAQKIYELCCKALGLIPRPLALPKKELKEERS